MLIKNLSDNQLLLEWSYWNKKIKETPGWGAAVAAANEFRAECESEILLRNLEIPNA